MKYRNFPSVITWCDSGSLLVLIPVYKSNDDERMSGINTTKKCQGFFPHVSLLMVAVESTKQFFYEFQHVGTIFKM